MGVDASFISADQSRALALAARHVNASTPVAISESMLLSSLRTGQAPDGFEHHLFAFIDETHPATLADLVISKAVTYGQLAVLADRMLPPRHGTRVWLNDRRAL